jgi:hypothetical protein
MSNVKPDTSLYTLPADRLEAFAAALRQEVLGGVLQAKSRFDNDWDDLSKSGRNYAGMSSNLITGGVEYRLKPKPRELWVAYDVRGHRIMSFDSRRDAENAGANWVGCTLERFVESPPGS